MLRRVLLIVLLLLVVVGMVLLLLLLVMVVLMGMGKMGVLLVVMRWRNGVLRREVICGGVGICGPRHGQHWIRLASHNGMSVLPVTVVLVHRHRDTAAHDHLAFRRRRRRRRRRCLVVVVVVGMETGVHLLLADAERSDNAHNTQAVYSLSLSLSLSHSDELTVVSKQRTDGGARRAAGTETAGGEFDGGTGGSLAASEQDTRIVTVSQSRKSRRVFLFCVWSPFESEPRCL
jgi:hypothetical protein